MSFFQSGPRQLARPTSFPGSPETRLLPLGRCRSQFCSGAGDAPRRPEGSQGPSVAMPMLGVPLAPSNSCGILPVPSSSTRRRLGRKTSCSPPYPFTQKTMTNPEKRVSLLYLMLLSPKLPLPRTSI